MTTSSTFPGTSAASELSPLVEIQDISFSYPASSSAKKGPKHALKDISFNLYPGQFHALLGPNGAGKSTLFSLISRLFSLQQGDIRLNGISLKQAPSQVLASIGMVFQQSTLDLDLTVAENLHYHASLHGMSRRARQPRIDHELARMHMSDAAHKKVRALNGGHRRRVEIARALLHEPQLLLLDEATVGLDPQTRRDINQHVRDLCHTRQVAVLWATHLIEEIQAHDTIALLHKSQLIACDTTPGICSMAGQSESEPFNLTHAFEHLTGTGATA